MPIETADIQWRYSGGSGNSDPDASLGGAISNTSWVGGTPHDLFDPISGDQNAAQTVDHRCVYIRNNHGSLTWHDVRVWFTNIVPDGATIEVGLDPAGVNGTATTIGDENASPAGVTFSVPESKAGGLIPGDIPSGQYQAIWFRRTATDSGPLNEDGFTIRAEGDTEE